MNFYVERIESEKVDSYNEMEEIVFFLTMKITRLRIL